jgi:hypothetical protein
MIEVLMGDEMLYVFTWHSESMAPGLILAAVKLVGDLEV